MSKRHATLGVKCPLCDAEPGDPCLDQRATRAGDLMKGFHRPRREEASVGVPSEKAGNAKDRIEQAASRLCPDGDGLVRELGDDDLDELYRDARMIVRAAEEERERRRS